jgi:membrane associated rhomboid family serine protease
MLLKLLTLPLFLVSQIFSLVFGSIKLVVSLVFGIVAFVFNHLTGTVFGALVGLLLGRQHVGVKLFTHHR